MDIFEQLEAALGEVKKAAAELVNENKALRREVQELRERLTIGKGEPK